MASTRSSSLHLFNFRGVDVFLHWSWFLVALLEINWNGGRYSSPTWNVLEYLELFLIVMLHEFGHAFACRQVGGIANRIVLWPLGGIAYVQPPQRPGAMLWSIAAGPLVNVVLMPILFALVMMSSVLELSQSTPDAHKFLVMVAFINGVLLVFNLLPIYPLDGGQILRSLLWFWVGRARSLMATSIIGMVGVAGLFLFSYLTRSVWNGAISVFILIYCWGGLRQARALLLRDDGPLDGEARARLQQALAQSEALALVVRFRERLKAIWQNAATGPDKAVAALEQWCCEAETSGVAALEQFARRLGGWRPATG